MEQAVSHRKKLRSLLYVLTMIVELRSLCGTTPLGCILTVASVFRALAGTVICLSLYSLGCSLTIALTVI